MGDLGKRVEMVMIIEALWHRGDFDLMENKPQNLSCAAFALLSFCFVYVLVFFMCDEILFQ